MSARKLLDDLCRPDWTDDERAIARHMVRAHATETLAALVEEHGLHEVLRMLGCVGTAYPTDRNPGRFISRLWPNTDPTTFPTEGDSDDVE